MIPSETAEERLDDIIHQSLLLIEKAEWRNSNKYVDKMADFDVVKTNPKYQSYLLFFEGTRTSNRKEKIKKLQQSIDLASTVDYKIVMSLAHTFLGIEYRYRGRDNDAIALEHWRKAMDLSDNTDDYHLAIK